MIKQSEILFTGKKVIQGLALASTLLVSAQADFLLTLTDKAGVEENICVKSYAFTNNLESIHKQQNQTIDEYSTDEVLTNKRWDGKPVYRRVLTIDNFSVPANSTGVTKTSEVVSNELEKVVSFYYSAMMNNDVLISPTNSMFNSESSSKWYRGAHFYYSTKKCTITFISKNSTQTISDVKFTVEYTKTTDTAVTNNSELTTLINYLPSNSTTGEYVVKSLDDVGVRVLKNYTYDSTTDSCIAPVN